jgi:hypothetical protein
VIDVKTERPILDYRRVEPREAERHVSRAAEWIVLVAFIVIDVIIFLVAG